MISLRLSQFAPRLQFFLLPILEFYADFTALGKVKQLGQSGRLIVMKNLFLAAQLIGITRIVLTSISEANVRTHVLFFRMVQGS